MAWMTRLPCWTHRFMVAMPSSIPRSSPAARRDLLNTQAMGRPVARVSSSTLGSASPGAWAVTLKCAPTKSPALGEEPPPTWRSVVRQVKVG